MNRRVQFLIISLLLGPVFGFKQSYSIVPFVGTCNKEVYNYILKAKADQIIQQITREFVPAFAKDSYINEQIKEKEFIAWKHLLACYYNFAQGTKKNNQQELYILNRYNDVATIIYETAKKIYQKQSLALSEKNTIKHSLENIKNELQAFSFHTYEILKQTDLPSSWKKSVPRTLEEIFSQYGNFFKSYTFGKQATANTLSDTKFEEFLKINKIPITRIGLENLLNKLEQFIYRLNQTWFKNSIQLALLRQANEIERRIIYQYPQFRFTTESFNLQLNMTTDKINLIIFSIAELYQGAIEKLLKNIDSLK